jgi:hypothetical protein
MMQRIACAARCSCGASTSNTSSSWIWGEGGGGGGGVEGVRFGEGEEKGMGHGGLVSRAGRGGAGWPGEPRQGRGGAHLQHHAAHAGAQKRRQLRVQADHDRLDDVRGGALGGGGWGNGGGGLGVGVGGWGWGWGWGWGVGVRGRWRWEQRVPWVGGSWRGQSRRWPAGAAGGGGRARERTRRICGPPAHLAYAVDRGAFRRGALLGAHAAAREAREVALAARQHLGGGGCEGEVGACVLGGETRGR